MLQRKHLLHALWILFLLILAAISGCTASTQEKGALNAKRQASCTTTTAPNYKFIDQDDVEWMTMRGGLFIDTKVLFQGNASDKIQRILEMVNAATNERASTEIEISYFHSRARPVGILVGFKDGKRAFIAPVYKRVGVGITPSSDRFMINYQDDNKYVTAYSKEVAGYLRDKWPHDMPVVEGIVQDKLKHKVGEKTTLSGDGCTSKEVTIYLQKFINGKEYLYLMGKVPTKFGQWNWHWIVREEFTTMDGRRIKLAVGQYYTFVVQAGDVSFGTTLQLID